LESSNGFENVKNQIGYCGIWCGSCMGGNGAVQELTRKYEEIVKKSKDALERYASKEFDFDGFMKGLTCVQAMQMCPGCKKGGGNPACAIRSCASKRNIENCSQCNELMECKNFEELQKYYPRTRDDLLKIKNADQKEVIEKWMNELKAKWPHCVLLCEATKQ
jgi:hypothetical protein